MQERQVTIGEKTYKLPEPFLVLATQNPIDQEGTYPLPEAQVDRFMLKVKISHPDRDEERQILDLMGRTSAAPETQQVVTIEDILKAREVINNIYIDDKVKDYIVDMVCCTREPARYEIEVTDFINSAPLRVPQWPSPSRPRRTPSSGVAALSRRRMSKASRRMSSAIACPSRSGRGRGENLRDDHPKNPR